MSLYRSMIGSLPFRASLSGKIIVGCNISCLSPRKIFIFGRLLGIIELPNSIAFSVLLLFPILLIAHMPFIIVNLRLLKNIN